VFIRVSKEDGGFIMKANTLSLTGPNLISLGLAIVGALILFAALSGRKLPLVSGDRAALIVLLVIGMAICANSGINRVAAAGAWAHPLAIAGYVLGALILIVTAAGFFGFKLPLVPNTHSAIAAVGLLAAGKIIVGILHRLIA